MAQPYNARMRTILLAGLVLLTACAGEASPNAEPTPAPQKVTGLITELRSEGGRFVSMVIETRQATHEILIDPARDYGFGLDHLQVHADDRLPVFVEVEERDGALYAVSILDA
jgi:hypothetical protein